MHRRLYRCFLQSSNLTLRSSKLPHLGCLPPFFTNYHVPESKSDAAAEAICQANMMMERMKTVHENSQATYDASAALRANVQVSKLSTDLFLLGYAT